MTWRGPASSVVVSVTSNYAVKTSAGVLYAVETNGVAGSLAYLNDGEIGASGPDFNNPGADALAIVSGDMSLGPEGVGFDKLDVALTSNARATIVYK